MVERFHLFRMVLTASDESNCFNGTIHPRKGSPVVVRVWFNIPQNGNAGPLTGAAPRTGGTYPYLLAAL